MNRSSLIRFGIAALILVATTGIYIYWQNQIGTAQDSVALLRTEINGKEFALRRVQSNRKSLVSLTSTDSAIQEYFVSDTNIVSFFGAFESISRKVKSKITIVSVAPQEGSAAHPMLRVSVKVSGSFNSVMRAIGSIENLPYYVIIKSVTLDRYGKNKSSKKVWAASLILSVGSVTKTVTTKS